MNMPHLTDLGAALEQSRSGLRDSHRRSLMRMLFVITGAALACFACLQVFNGFPWVGAGELLLCVILFFGVWRLQVTPYLQQWIYVYLVSLFSFFIIIMVLPEASTAAFAWVLMMPVLAYLLLGKHEGMILSIPFMTAGCVAYYCYLGSAGNARTLIDLLNMVLCAVLMLAFIHLYEVRREEAEQRLVDMAQTDALTGLANRSSFQSTLARTIAESERNGSGFALVIMDIDHFKMVNDTLGHDAGDLVLSSIGHCLRERLRSTDFVARLGGEEFGVILRDVRPGMAYDLMDELRQRIARRELAYGDAVIRVTACFGIAQWPDNGRDAQTLFRAADRCLYRGKRAGRNCVSRAGLEPPLQGGALAGGDA